MASLLADALHQPASLAEPPAAPAPAKQGGKTSSTSGGKAAAAAAAAGVQPAAVSLQLLLDLDLVELPWEALSEIRRTCGSVGRCFSLAQLRDLLLLPQVQPKRHVTSARVWHVQTQAVARCDNICHYACSSPAEQLSWSAEIDTKVWGKSMLNVRVYTVSTCTGFVQAGGVQQGPDAPAALDLARLSYLVDPLHHMSAVTERPGCYAAPLIPCFRWGQAFLMKCAAAVLPLLSLCWLLVEQLLAASICPTPMFTCPDDHVGVAVADRGTVQHLKTQQLSQALKLRSLDCLNCSTVNLVQCTGFATTAFTNQSAHVYVYAGSS